MFPSDLVSKNCVVGPLGSGLPRNWFWYFGKGSSWRFIGMSVLLMARHERRDTTAGRTDGLYDKESD